MGRGIVKVGTGPPGPNHHPESVEKVVPPE